jgi:hypothetical protein
MHRSAWLIAGLALGPMGCGYAIQESSVRRSFQSRFGCSEVTVSGVSDGWHVEGCGRTAEYACVPDGSEPHYHASSGGEIVAGIVVGALMAGMHEKCVLAQSEDAPLLAPVASAAPAHVQRLDSMAGGAVIKTRALFAQGFVGAFGRPSLHPGHALLVVHSTARMPPEPCQVELFDDGVPVRVLQHARFSDYEEQLVVPIEALDQLESAARFAGSVCGVEIDLDASGRSTLGAFAARFRAERSKIEQVNTAAVIKRRTLKIEDPHGLR